MATKPITSVIAHIDLSVYVKCPYCHAQLNEVSNRPELDTIILQMERKGLESIKDDITCPKCKGLFNVKGCNH